MERTEPRSARRRLRSLAGLVVAASATSMVSSSPVNLASTLAVAQCAACEVPTASELSFCAAFATYSACRTGSSWSAMDASAEAQYETLVNGTDALAKADKSCLIVLKRTQCAAVFNVCEMGTPESLCLDSCTAAIETNCSSTLSTSQLTAVETDACGDTSTPLTGVSDGGKCFDTDYNGPQRSAWIAGFVIAVVFSFFASVGINLQKKGLKQNELGPAPVPVYRLPLWCLGFVLIAAGSILDFVAFGLAPQSLLAPLAALTLVWNMMLAPCFNKEKLSKKDIAATLVIFLGATLAVVFASHASPSYNLDMLLELYKDPLTIVYFVVVFLTVLLHFGAIQLVEKLCLTSRRHRLIQVGTPAVWSTVRLVGYAGLAGTMGGQSVLFAKSSAELLKVVFHGDASCFVHFQTYLIALALILCLLCQIHYLNGGLVDYDALSVVPVYQAYWIISGVLGGVIYFQEIRSFTVLQAVMFVLGIGTTIFGVVLLSHRKHAPSAAGAKGKFVLERGFSFTSPPASDSKHEPPRSSDGRLARVSEGLGASIFMPEADGTAHSDTEREALASIRERHNEESATEESDDDDGSGERRSDNDGDASDQVNRHAMDNYLDMSTTVCLSEILDGLGFQRSQPSSLLGRRSSNRGSSSSRRRPRRSVDDIELGMPTATREANPLEAVPKRRSITFTSFRASADKDTSRKDPDRPKDC